MPLFEYQCLECDRVFEVFVQRVDPMAAPVCPGCEKTNVERLWSPFSGRNSGRGSCVTTSSGVG
ncbi:MAG: zinc ribbon domain-containing protein [candidate division NC10 bacterium]|nr:zinc ribbon domain-containing protein [candidate division NC10 bacterium]